MIPAGIEPATFRFVAQHLNHCTTAVPFYWCNYILYSRLKAGTVIRYLLSRLGRTNQSSILGRSNIFLYSEMPRLNLTPNQHSKQWEPVSFSRKYSGRKVKLTTHLHLIPICGTNVDMPMLHHLNFRRLTSTIVDVPHR